MKITFWKGIYIAEATFDERHALKGAGFIWHDPSRGKCFPNCGACRAGAGKRWWTKRPESAALLRAFCNEAASAALDSHIRAVEDSRATDADFDFPSPAGLSYLPYQKAGIAYACQREAVLIADEPGLGKTIQTLGLVNTCKDIKSVLVICPATLRVNWLREAFGNEFKRGWLVKDDRVWVPYIVESGKPIPSDANFVIMNFDRTLQQSPLPPAGQSKWDLIVVDEAHACKSPKAQRTHAIIGELPKGFSTRQGGLASIARRKMYLTGTPILNRPIEIHPLLSSLLPEKFGAFFPFVKRYCDAKKEMIPGKERRIIWNFKGASHLEELQERLRGSCMVRRLKIDVLKDLPPKRRQVIHLPSAGLEQEIAEEQDAFDESEGKTAFEGLSAARAALGVAKMPMVIEHLEELLESLDKVVVMAHHHNVVDGIAAHFGDAAVRLRGGVSDADKNLAVDRFQNDPTCKVFVGGIQAAGVGITLTAAQTIVFAELDWVPGIVGQAEDRIHRIGQTGSVLVQHLVVDGSIDADMAAMLVAKQEILDRSLDRKTNIEAQAQLAQDLAEKRAQKVYPALSPKTKETLLEGLRVIASRCDGAVALDGAGFSKIDGPIGRSLAARPALSDGQGSIAIRLLTKYRRQLPVRIVSELGIEAKAKAPKVKKMKEAA